MKGEWKRWPALERVNLRRDVDDELAFHIDTLTRELQASGMSAAAARDEAERRFGAVGSIRDQCLTIDRRRARRLSLTELLAMRLADLRVAARAMRHAPVFSATVVGTLAIGIGSASAIFTVVNAILIKPLPYRDPSRLVSITHDLPSVNLHHAGITTGMFLTYRRLSHTLTDLALSQGPNSTALRDPSGIANPVHVTTEFITANLVPMLGVSPELGRSFTSEEDAPKAPRVMLISDALWRSYFGADPGVLGKSFVVHGLRTTIVGVMPPSFRFPDAAAQLWLPLAIDSTAQYLSGFNGGAIARLRPGASVADAQREVRDLMPRTAELFPSMTPGITFDLVLKQARPVPFVISLRDDIVSDVAGTLWMVAAAAALVLIVTAANVANLLLVRGDGRQHELSVRAALGAGGGRILAHFVSESLVFSGIAGTMGLLVAWVATRLLMRSSPVQLPRIGEVHVDGWTAAFTMLIAVAVGAGCSLLPALRFMHGGLLAGLRDRGRGGTAGIARQRARSTLVAAQMALALVALVASGLLLRSFERVRGVKAGFNPNGVATLWVMAPAARYPKQLDAVHLFSRVADAVSHLPGVTSAGVASRVPLSGSVSLPRSTLLVEGTWDASKPIPPVQLYAAADAGYFRTMQIPLVAGRLFDPIETQRGLDAVVSTVTARQLFNDSTGRHTVGRRFQNRPNGPFYTVIGVIGAARDTSLFHEPTMSVYMPESVNADSVEGPFAHTIIAVVARTSGDVDATVRAMRRAIRDIDPTLATFGEQSMSTVVNASMARLTFIIIVLGAAAAVTLVLGAVGLYGVIAYVVALRTRELGLRIALGATPRAVSAMIARQGLALGIAGTVTGLALVFALGRFLSRFLFEVTPLDPLTMSLAALVLVVCAFLATWLPARRAAGIDPAKTLRAE